MPATSGWATRSRASAPSRRRTNAPRLSSSPPTAPPPPRGNTRSSAIRALPRHENNDDVAKGTSRVGASSWNPWQRMQPPAKPDEDAPVAVVGADESILHAEPATQRERPGLFRQERVGTGLDQEAVGALGRDRPAQPTAGLDDAHVEVDAALARQLHRAVGCGEGRDAAAHDDDVHAASRTSSASISTNSG